MQMIMSKITLALINSRLKTPFQFFDLDRFEWEKTRFHFLVRRLKKFTKYEMVVQAVNIHGEGPLSDIMVGQTKEDGK